MGDVSDKSAYITVCNLVTVMTRKYIGVKIKFKAKCLIEDSLFSEKEKYK